MARITIGASHDQSSLILRATLLETSNLELDVGEGTDMSTRQIDIIERRRGELESALEHLRAIARETQATGPAADALRNEVEQLASTAETTMKSRKWYSFSAAGLVDAAKTVGTAAEPIIGAAAKLVSLLHAAQG